ncbi:hypothetical protein DKX38_010961 [Salix brachista]|uniref:Pectinesterase n=1 Tax=Salix brachista TaxID=2182728 RepID=A0A5N5LXK4_9ROSI|nr:hypothetical protein DKX38_010961 [Salix brachista]
MAYITLQGAGADKTIIEWGDTADRVENGRQLGTFGSATFAVNSPYFIAKDITFKNKAPLPPSGALGKQAVALRISADTAAFISCKFIGAQDTLYDHIGRHYFKKCYIEGSVDFIFGNGLSLYEDCHLHAVTTSFGALTAQKRQSFLEETGFSFVNCRITGSGALYLGRAWGNFSRVVFAYTYMDKIITPTGCWYESTRDPQMKRKHDVEGEGEERDRVADEEDEKINSFYTLVRNILPRKIMGSSNFKVNFADEDGTMAGVRLEGAKQQEREKKNEKRTVFFGQYKCSGPGADFGGRVAWSRELTEQQAKPFISIGFIDGHEWLFNS